MLHLRDFMLQAGDRRGGRGLLRLQLRRIEHGNQISGFHRRAFIHQQFLDASLTCALTITWFASTVPISTRSREWSVEKK